MFNNHPFIHQVWVWNKKQDKLQNLFRLIFSIRKEQYDEVINLQRFFSSGLLTVFSGGKSTSGFVKNPLSFFFTHRYPHIIGNGMHETARNHQLIGHFGAGAPERPALYPSDRDVEAVKNLVPSPYVCIAPASVWFTKQLPVSKWAELIEKVKSRFNIALIGGKEDSELCDEIIRLAKTQAVNLAGKLSLLQTAALMKNATMNYVNDSAPLHIASAMNAPVSAFFLSTVTEFGFGPLSDVSKVYHAQPVPACRPCGLHGKKSCPEKHFNCAMHIPVTDSLLP